jgi:hypothetical protein
MGKVKCGEERRISRSEKGEKEKRRKGEKENQRT